MTHHTTNIGLRKIKKKTYLATHSTYVMRHDIWLKVTQIMRKENPLLPFHGLLVPVSRKVFEIDVSAQIVKYHSICFNAGWNKEWKCFI